jgi:hypothetical protein
MGGNGGQGAVTVTKAAGHGHQFEFPSAVSSFTFREHRFLAVAAAVPRPSRNRMQTAGPLSSSNVIRIPIHDRSRSGLAGGNGLPASARLSFVNGVSSIVRSPTALPHGRHAKS